jgi:proteasome lid subunit RPN8/RPN11
MGFDVWSVVAPSALRTIRDHVCATPDVEVGGFLVGRHGAPGEPPVVEAAIEAFAAEGDVSRLTFTHEAWERVHELQEERWPDTSFVGWYHSHPNHGIFLSEYDQFIQRNFFGEPWQIAIVVDPKRRAEGLFAWDHGEIVKLSERPFGAPGRLIPATAAARSAFKAAPEPRRRARKFVIDVDDLAEPPAHEPTPIEPRPIDISDGAVAQPPEDQRHYVLGFTDEHDAAPAEHAWVDEASTAPAPARWTGLILPVTTGFATGLAAGILTIAS